VSSPDIATRTALHTVAAHVLGRRRFVVSGRFGLRAAPGGIATPAFGDGPETIRISGTTLVREVGAVTTRLAINGSTLGQLARFADVDLDEPFAVGADTPSIGSPDAALALDPAAVALIADWFTLAWRVLDDVVASLTGDVEVATTQLWPEHFDAATSVTVAPAKPVNLGFSPGDGFESEPYLYVGPWGSERPGDANFWNAPFGAVCRRAEVHSAPDPVAACRRFLTEGLDRLVSA
jgi:hypothetical protein